MSSRTALVTGASAGIGAAIARELARRGFDVVLVARREDRLVALAEELRRTHGVAARAIVADLADEAAPERLRDDVAGAGGTVDVLVNNAGNGVRERFTQTPWSVQRDLLRVMLTSVLHLAHLFVPGMVERGWGRVLNVASVAAFVPERPGALYGPVKRFVVGASYALALELEGTGVTVTALCPGFTRSEFHDVMGTRAQADRVPRWMWMDSAAVARGGVEAMMKGRALHVSGPVNRAVTWGCRVLPPGLIRALSPFRRDSRAPRGGRRHAP
jgi:uncharacterized protein